jgi:radical SAM protein with 4Fe4S-binding SPASM domain
MYGNKRKRMPVIKLHPRFKLRIERGAAYGIQGDSQEKIKYTDEERIFYLYLAEQGKFDFQAPLLDEWQEKKIIAIAPGGGIAPDREKEKNKLRKIMAGRPADYTSFPLMLHVGITEKCVLSCRHCGNSSGPHRKSHLAADTIRRIIDECRRMKILKLTFTGGEPLTRDDIFEHVAHAKRYIPRVSLTSNGMLLDKNAARKLARAGVSMVKISLDGLEKFHDRLRGRTGSYRAAINAIRHLRDNNIEVRVQSTLMKQNRNDLAALADITGRLGANVHTIVPLSPIGRASRSDMLSPAEYKDFINAFAEEISHFEHKTVYQIRPVFDLDMKIDLKTLSTKYICEALTNSMEIKANGDIVPCSFFDIKLGNIYRDRLADVWTAARTDRIRKYFRPENLAGACRSCASRERCGGGCLANAYALHNQLHARDVYCWR